jgi:hypothetical protein
MSAPDLFPLATTRDVTTERKRAELEREIRMREKVYPRWVAQGKMSATEADARILVMRAVLEDYPAA